MKKILKKIIVMVLLASFLLYVAIGSNKVVNATENTDDYLSYSGFDNDLKSNLKRSTYNNLMAGNNNVSSSYNLSKDYNIIVKNQQKVGSCWAFAYSSMIESSIKNNKEYSPMHIEYKASELFNRELGSGGSFDLALTYLASGYGPVYESDFSFESVYNEKVNSEENSYLIDLDKVDLSKYTRKS